MTDNAASREARALELLAQAFERAGDARRAQCVRQSKEKRLRGKGGYSIPVHMDVSIDAILTALADEAASQPRERVKPLTAAEHGELCGYIHGRDYRDNTVEAVAYRKRRFDELKQRHARVLDDTAPTDQAQGGGEVEGLRKALAALKPFSDALGDKAADDHAMWADDQTIEFDGFAEHITVGDLRRARAVLAQSGDPS